MSDWIVKKEDIIHWFHASQQVFSGGTACIANSLPTLSTSGLQVCDPPSRKSTANGDNKSTKVQGFALDSTDHRNEILILKQLRSNPSLVKGGSFSSSSFIASEKREQQSVPSLLEGGSFSSPSLVAGKQRDQQSIPSLVEGGSFSSSSLIEGKKRDQQSIGSETLPESDDEEVIETISKNKRINTRFLLCILLAFILAVLFIVLIVMIPKGRTISNNRLGDSAVIAGNNGERDDQKIIDDYTANANVDGNRDDQKIVDDYTSNAQVVGDRDDQKIIDDYTANAEVDGERNDQKIMDDYAASTEVDGEFEDQKVKYDYTANTDYLVGAYYYPWHGENFHNGEGYLRKDLVPQHQPLLGEYNDSEAHVIAKHMEWFRQANIGLLVTSWWGPNKAEDTTTKNVILEHEDIGNLKIALHYETTGRIKDDRNMSVPRSDIQHMCENYFDHPNYYKINGRPVLVVYVTRVLHRDGILEEVLLTMRSEASKCGHNLYLVGDQVFNSAPNPNDASVPFWYFDAVTNYDVYGSSGRPDGYAGKDVVDKYYSEQKKWRDQALKENCQYIPTVSPGYNDRGVRLDKDNPPLSRRLTPSSEEGSLFWYQLKQALPLASPQNELVDFFVNSFNEWHEDTQIEPAVSANPNYVATTQPNLLTGGLEYVAYGELYLDLLGAATSKNTEDKDAFNQFYN